MASRLIRSFLEEEKPEVFGIGSMAEFMRAFDPLKAKGIGVDKPMEKQGPIGTASVPTPPDPLLTLIQPETMPSPNSGRDARRRSLKSQLARRGRLSTILTEADDSLGATG
jgi:hypothetical protein